jgi:PPK2 family polyphosphate:nucleotide phosphotransferase
MEDGHTQLAALIEPLRVEPGSRIDVAKDLDPRFDAGIRRKDGDRLLAESLSRLSEYQSRLAAQDTWAVLLVLQGMDAAGKDGTVRHVMSGVNPQGVRVESFKEPSLEELDHDYLWRHGQRLPARGEIGIFNRSHYEEVLAVRVHADALGREKLPEGTVDRHLWKRRFDDINAWERYLTDNGIHIVKLFLNISKEEQRIRLLRRLELPHHSWKFSVADLAERRLWDDYQVAYSDMLSHTSTQWAPWYAIPADRKWFMRLCAAAVIVDALVAIDPRYPAVDPARRMELQRVRQALMAEAPEGAAPDPFHARRASTDDVPPA